MIHKLLKQESGYSLVEVIVAMFILAAAIIPMVGMFDMGLNAATRGSHYDKARALANTNLEKVRSLAYVTARETYEPVNAPITPSNPAAGTPVSCDEGVYDCEVTTTYVNDDLTQASNATTTMQVTVTVQWGDSDPYTTNGLKAR